MEKISSGLSQNMAGALTYLLGFVTGIIFLLMEKENRFVRFHAMQSTVFSGAYFVISTVLMWIPVVNVAWAVIALPLGLAIFIYWLYLMYQAYQGKQYKIPFFGEFAEKQLGNLKI